MRTGSAVERRFALPCRADPAFAIDALVDHAQHRPAIFQQRDQRAEYRAPGHEADGAVDWVEQPSCAPNCPAFSPYSSPIMASSRGHSASSIRRIAASAARSASVTGEASCFWLRAESARKNGRIAVARRIGKPVGKGDVGGRHQSNSERHRTFIGNPLDGLAEQRRNRQSCRIFGQSATASVPGSNR